LRGEGWERVIKSMAKGLTHLAKGLRKRSTDVEQLLWSRLRAGRFEGMKFRRQHPIGQYIADFVCLERKLIIELDGGQHALPDEILKDRQRDAWLEKEGYTVIRFWDNEVLANTSGVLEAIRERLHRTPSPQSPPLKGGDVITHTK
jgi:very-short-patch-repair endonuclease